MKEIKAERVDQHLDYVIIAKDTDIPFKLKEWRKCRNLTLRQVEAITEISNARISQIENSNTCNFSFENIRKLLSCYSVRLTIN